MLEYLLHGSFLELARSTSNHGLLLIDVCATLKQSWTELYYKYGKENCEEPLDTKYGLCNTFQWAHIVRACVKIIISSYSNKIGNIYIKITFKCVAESLSYF